MNPRDIKRRANAIRKAMTGEPLYDRKYKDLRVAEGKGLTLEKRQVETIKHRYYKLGDETWEQLSIIMDDMKGERQ